MTNRFFGFVPRIQYTSVSSPIGYKMEESHVRLVSSVKTHDQFKYQSLGLFLLTAVCSNNPLKFEFADIKLPKQQIVCYHGELIAFLNH